MQGLVPTKSGKLVTNKRVMGTQSLWYIWSEDKAVWPDPTEALQLHKMLQKVYCGYDGTVSHFLFHRMHSRVSVLYLRWKRWNRMGYIKARGRSVMLWEMFWETSILKINLHCSHMGTLQ